MSIWTYFYNDQVFFTAINLTRQYDKAVTAEGTARDMLKTTYTGN